ncbi:MAG: type II toxin-antitoxin system RelE/ParE family toxin [Sulfuricellaceae bacterium]|nr:type II toxin-antitoxin system RelE/ParE family toxin [Sulfuricellaceae bacterium]
MIKNFRHVGLQDFYETGSKAGIRPDHAPRLKRILGVLDAALVIGQVDVPGFRLHKLSGALSGFWAVTVNGNWRIIFRFENGEVELVDYLDHH